MNRRSWDSASSYWFMSLQCASPQAAAKQSHQSAAVPGGKTLLTADLLSSALSCRGPLPDIIPNLSAAFDGHTGFLCGRKEEETGGISVLLFGP